MMQGYSSPNLSSGNNYAAPMTNIFAGLGGLFGANGQNPADAASPYLSKIQDALKQYLMPYVNQGQNTMGQLQGQYGQLTNGLPQIQGQFSSLMSGGAPLQSQYSKMMSDPGGNLNKIGQSFQQSPGFDFQKNQAVDAANKAAAAGGMLGSPAEQQQIAGTVNGMANQDYYNYLSHATNQQAQGLQGMNNLYNTGLTGATELYGRGLNGMEGLNKMGFDASNGLAQNLSQALMSQANLAYSGQNNQNQQQGGSWGSILGGLGGLASLFL